MRATAALAAVALTGALVSSCAPAPPMSPANEDPGAQINTNTPPGARAQQIVDMLNSDWPIGPNGVRTLAAPDMVDHVGLMMERLWWDRPIKVTDVDIGAGTATLRLLTSFGSSQNLDIRTDDDTMVNRFYLELARPKITSWSDVDAELTKSGARYSYQVAQVNDGRCEKVVGTNTAESLPLASIFKLYVLYAVAAAVREGTVSWDDQLTVTSRAKAVGSSGLEELPPGAQVSVRTAAEKMIATSDNMATDLLIERIGTYAVERALVATGHHNPQSMTPFPTMHELFSVGWGKPDLREQWRQASPQARARLLQQTNSRPYEPDPKRTHTPASNYGAEWYGSAEDICRVHVGLQNLAIGAAPVREILSAIPGIDLDPQHWPYVGAKAGNLPGDLTFSWYAEDHTGQGWVVSFQLNWPRYHGPNTAGWVHSIADQVFTLITYPS